MIRVTILVFVAAFLDSFCLTGLFFNGLLLLGAASFAYAAGLNIFVIFTAAFLGGVLVDNINFNIGRLKDRETIPLKYKARLEKFSKIIDKHDAWLGLLILKFFSFTRPVSPMFFGFMSSMKRSDYIWVSLVICAIWAAVWTLFLFFAFNLFSEVELLQNLLDKSTVVFERFLKKTDF